MADLTLESFGDKELRTVKITLPDGEGILPVLVTYYRGGNKEYAKVSPAVGLYPEQASRLEYHFGSYNQWKKRDSFLIERRHLQQLTSKVSGITPSYYYQWPGKEALPPQPDKLRVNGEEIAPIPDDAEDFLEHVHKKRGIDRNVLRLAWSAVSKEAATWMFKKKKPINLGFVNLYAVPYRANWKEILLAKFPNAQWWFTHNLNKDGEFKNRLACAEFQTELASLSMMAIHNRDHYIYWTMEAVPTENWESDIADMELTRKAGGNTSYVRFYEKTIADFLPRILEVFTAYVSKATRSFPEIRSGNMDGSKKFLPYRGKRNILPEFGKNIAVSIVASSGPPKLGEESQFKPLQPAFVHGLQNLPRLLPATNDVRKPVEQREVDEPVNGTAGTNGLHVPPPSESVDTGKSVLAIKSVEREDGVEQAIDI